MTTIIIHEDLPLEQKAFGSVSELFAALEEQNLFVVLHELSDDDVTADETSMAEQARKEFSTDDSTFSDL